MYCFFTHIKYFSRWTGFGPGNDQNSLISAMSDTYDAIIIGAGPGGCSAAAFLSGAGRDVLLVDRARFPRDKTCGDGLSVTALPVLERMGVLEKVEAHNPWKCDGVILSSPNDVVMRGRATQVGGVYNYGYVIPRKIFDTALFEHVRDLPHVTVREECAFRDFIHEGNAICGIRARSGNNEEFEVRGRFIIGADGVHSAVARKLGNHASGSIKKAFAVRAYFENVDGLEHLIALHYEKTILPGYAWIFPTGERSANVGVGMICQGKPPHNMKDLFEMFITRNRFAREKLGRATMVEGSFKGAHLATGTMGVRRSFGNVLLVGDAGGFVDALTGEGIYYALRSGEQAASAIIEVLARKEATGDVGAIYDGSWRRDFRRDIIFGNLFQKALTKKSLMNLIVWRSSRNQAKADILSGVIQHALPKTRLFRVI